jgi:hypothetical protein
MTLLRVTYANARLARAVRLSLFERKGNLAQFLNLVGIGTASQQDARADTVNGSDFIALCLHPLGI